MYVLWLLGAWLSLAILGIVATALWARRLWLKRGETPRWAGAVAAVIAAAVMFGAIETALGLVKAFGAVGGESVDPELQARILAEGISQAMNCTVFGSGVWLLGLVVLTALSRWYPRQSG